MKFGTGLNTEQTQKYERVKVQNDIRRSKHIYKQTNIPDFQLCYPCKSHSPIIILFIYLFIITTTVVIIINIMLVSQKR